MMIDFPAVNASLNALAAVLLISGYAAIRRRRIALHKTCMLSAFFVSTLFLCCYLYYHIVVRHGESTPFPGRGFIRPIYYAILISHILLAMITVPLALLTIRRAFHGKLEHHMRMARWTLPIWL